MSDWGLGIGDQGSGVSDWGMRIAECGFAICHSLFADLTDGPVREHVRGAAARSAGTRRCYPEQRGGLGGPVWLAAIGRDVDGAAGGGVQVEAAGMMLAQMQALANDHAWSAVVIRNLEVDCRDSFFRVYTYLAGTGTTASIVRLGHPLPECPRHQ